MVYTLGEIADQVGATVHGDADLEIHNVATLENATAKDLGFFSNRRYVQALRNTRAAAVILKQEDIDSCPVSSLVVSDPYVAFAHISSLLNPVKDITPGIHPTATIDPSARVDPSCEIGPHVIIGADCEIGEKVLLAPGTIIANDVRIKRNSRLMSNVTIYEGTSIGCDCLIHSGVVLGADGFGIANDKGKWVKIPQIGNVIIGNDVEIGANTTIDRGALEDTVIGDGVKIDNQVQIGHNVHIGNDTAIAGCVAIAGSTHIGQRCMIGGACGISGHIEICDDVILMGMSGVANSIKEPGMYASGIPVTDVRLWRKNIVTFKQLYSMNSRLKKIENQK